MGALNALNSVMIVLGPMIGTPLIAAVSRLPHDHWAAGAPMYAGALMQCLGLGVAILHFRRNGGLRRPAAAAI
jgi:DHA1 family tetracycline resistance protein-like MFS transporter